MKKGTVFALFLLPIVALAQPTMTYQSHGLKVGEDNNMQQIEYVAPGEPGAKQVWDYSAITPIKEGRTETLAVGASGKTLVTSADGAVFTYLCNNHANVFEGYESASRKVAYLQPITKIRYPFTFGDALSGSFNASVLYGKDYSTGGSMAGIYSSEADAYGVLLLPNNVKLYDVLRVKTKESYVEQMCNNTQVDIVKYLWYSANYRYPVVVTWNITYTYENGKTATVNESFYTTAALTTTPEPPADVLTVAQNAVSETPATIQVTPEIEYSVYPNPYNSYFHLTYSLEKETLVDVALFSASGRYVKHLVKNAKQSGIQHITYNPQSADMTGIYFLRMTFNEKVYVQPLIKE